MPDDVPFDDRRLREAYRDGHRAWAEGKPVPDEFFDDGLREAFRQGYEDAETQEPTR
jgi:hypothetical protein